MLSSAVPVLLAVGLPAIGLLFVVRGTRTLRLDAERRRTWVRCPGQVVASQLDDDQVRCQVAYRRPDGTEVLFWNRYTSTVLRDPVGRPVQVLVNPADRHDAVVGSGLVGGSTVGAVLVAFGALGVLIGAGIGLFLLR